MNNKKFEESFKDGIRINKFLSDSGVCSRREADTLVEKGEVFVDGIKAENGTKVQEGQKVTVSGKEVKRDENLVLLALYKPTGIVCTTDPSEPDNVIDFLKYPKRVFPIGRLDKDSEGLLLLTNDGDIVNKILRAGNKHEKEYEVTVNKPLTPEFLRGMSRGVPILDTVTKPCKIEPIGKNSFKIILTQGLNRQIRRMCEYFDYRVISLKRVRIMHITLNHLKVGEFRKLSDGEISELRVVLQNSSKLGAAQTAEKAKTKEFAGHASANKPTKSYSGAGKKEYVNGRKENKNRISGRTAK